MTELVSTEKDIQTYCKTCNADLIGPYCSKCGQKDRSKRFTLRGVIKDALAQFFSFDRGVIHTLISLIQKPGEVVVQYVSGRTILFTNPFRYFLLWITVAQLIALWSGAVNDFIEGFVNGGGLETDAQKIVSFLTSYYVFGLAGSFPFLVLGTLLFFFRTGRNVAEHTIFHLYLSGQFAFYVSLSLVFLKVFGEIAGGITFVLAVVAGFTGVTRASIQFLQRWQVKRNPIGAFSNKWCCSCLSTYDHAKPLCIVLVEVPLIIHNNTRFYGC